MKMWVGEQWVDSSRSDEVLSPYNGQPVDVVPVADLADVERAISTAERGARDIAALPASQRAAILDRAANLAATRVEEFAKLITSEEGKPLSESRGEASRLADLLRLSAFEGSQMRGESLPLDAQAGAVGK